jgi:hypothetical protein
VSRADGATGCYHTAICRADGATECYHTAICRADGATGCYHTAICRADGATECYHTAICIVVPTYISLCTYMQISKHTRHACIPLRKYHPTKACSEKETQTEEG